MQIHTYGRQYLLLPKGLLAGSGKRLLFPWCFNNWQAGRAVCAANGNGSMVEVETGISFSTLEDGGEDDAAAASSLAEYKPISGIATLASFDIDFEPDDDAAEIPSSELSPSAAVSPGDLPPRTDNSSEFAEYDIPDNLPDANTAVGGMPAPSADDIVEKFLAVYKEKLSAEKNIPPSENNGAENAGKSPSPELSLIDLPPVAEPPQPPFPDNFTDAATVVTGVYNRPRISGEKKTNAESSATTATIVIPQSSADPEENSEANSVSDEPYISPLAQRQQLPAGGGGLLDATRMWLNKLHNIRGTFTNIGSWLNLRRWFSRNPQSAADTAFREQDGGMDADKLAAVNDAAEEIIPASDAVIGADDNSAGETSAVTVLEEAVAAGMDDAAPANETAATLSLSREGGSGNDEWVTDDLTAGDGDTLDILAAIGSEPTALEETVDDYADTALQQAAQEDDGGENTAADFFSSSAPVDIADDDDADAEIGSDEFWDSRDLGGDLPESGDRSVSAAGKTWKFEAAEDAEDDGWNTIPAGGGSNETGWKTITKGTSALPDDEWKTSKIAISEENTDNWITVPKSTGAVDDEWDIVAGTSADTNTFDDEKQWDSAAEDEDNAEDEESGSADIGGYASEAEDEDFTADSGELPSEDSSPHSGMMPSDDDDMSTDALRSLVVDADSPEAEFLIRTAGENIASSDSGDWSDDFASPEEEEVMETSAPLWADEDSAEPSAVSAEDGMLLPPAIAGLWRMISVFVRYCRNSGGKLLGKILHRQSREEPSSPAAAPETAAPDNNGIDAAKRVIAAADENEIIDAAPAAAANGGWDTGDFAASSTVDINDLDDILPTATSAAESAADGGWQDTASIGAVSANEPPMPDSGDTGSSSIILPSDSGLENIDGIFDADSVSVAENDAAEDAVDAASRSQIIKDSVRRWSRLLYAYADSRLDFKKNWWLLLDGLSLIIMTMSLAAIVAYFLYYC